ncbi:MAG: DUF523 domain-containing protein [Halioglobus sp.]
MSSSAPTALPKILVSACLLGNRVRYDGEALTLEDAILARWLAAGQVVSVCPEVEGGLPVPRPPAEIVGGAAVKVLAAEAQVIDNNDEDVSGYFVSGAKRALSLCQRHSISVAVLTEGSPSCGSSAVYDGTFSRNRIPGQGVTTALLRSRGITVFSQYELAAADRVLNSNY